MKKALLRSGLIILSTFGVLFTSCKDDDDTEPTPASTEQNLTFHIHTNVGATSVVYGTNYAHTDGRTFNLSDLRYYISNIVLIKQDNSELPISGKVLLVNPSENEYSLGKVPVGSYKGFRFYLGLDSATNHTDPTTYTSENPLSIQTPSIHWSWNSGYIFMKIEGLVDTSLAGNGNVNFPFFYHVGLDQNTKTIDFTNEAFTVASGSDKEIGLEFDLLSTLTNVDMRTENATHTMDNMPLATKIADNWTISFEIE
ncbi:MAG: hypothetical protein IPP34_16315 [Bacteroidetes bacterium]|nr:hypothetical protein [Bacteroidota bacterium]